jgi:dTDP-L-rhamnose 4-epimerase
MSKRILITGGAGFIGSHLADQLLKKGYRVRALDNLCMQVHGPARDRPRHLADAVELVEGDLCDAQTVRRSLQGVDAVVHLAAAVGVGQSMYQVVDYTRTNNLGTAVLLEALLEQPVQRLVVASSMSIYGEGLYRAPDAQISTPLDRTIDQLKNRQWEVRNNRGEVLTPLPTPETKPPALSSIYALSKFDQERMCLMIGRAYNIPTVALRFFNVYGPRQALSNPYTGVAAIFSSRLLNGNPPLIFEDGLQSRDFVSVHDVVRALLLAAERPEAVGQAINVGSGRSITVREIAGTLAGVLGREVEPQITARYRVGDIRHCFADISLARRLLEYRPAITLEGGMRELVEWLQEQDRPADRVAGHAAELAARGLTV